MSCIFVLVFFSKVFCIVVNIVCFAHTCKSLKRLGKNKHKSKHKTNTHKKHSRKKTQHTTNTGPPAHHFAEVFFCFRLLCLCLFCLYLCFFDCKCKSLNRLGENIKQQQTNSEKLREHQKNIDTGSPAQDPTANKYIRFRLGNNVFSCFNVLYIYIYIYFLLMCFLSAAAAANTYYYHHYY